MKLSGIKIAEVRIRNFRSLKSVDVGIDTLTIFVGANNSGKTSCLEALMFAMGYGAKPVTDDDIYVGPGETSPPISRSIVIDTLIKPIDEAGKVIDAFPSGSYWLTLWGNGTSQDENDNEFMAFRTNYFWSDQKASYQVERKFLRDWRKDSSRLRESKTIDEAGLMSLKMIEPMALYFMDAKRDIDEDLKKQSSFWRKMTRDLIITDPKEKKALEKILTDLNFQMVEKSEILKHIKRHIDELKHFISTDIDGVHISSVPRTLRDIAKGIDISFTTKGAQSFPLSRHGMGTRSLAAILVFRAYMTWKIRQIGEDDIHSMLALEEPESHLHPQAQRALIDDMKKIPGQVLISTHSPYISSKTSIEHIRCFFKDGSESYVSSISSKELMPKEIETLNRRILNTRGDMLFARALVFFEGPTEEIALPMFAENYLGKSINHFGLSFIPVEGDNYKPFILMAHHFRMPWFIFSDGEKQIIKKVEKAINTIGLTNVHKQDNIVIIPDGLCFESFCVLKGHVEAIKNMLNEFHKSADYLAYYISLNHGQKAKGGKKKRDYKSTGGEEKALIDILSDNKVGYARFLARHILASKKERKIPEPIESLLEMIAKKIKATEK